MAFVLQLLGGFRLVDDDGRSISLPDRARALLAYLALAPAPVPRKVLGELLSAEGDEREQRTTVRQTAYLARKAMADGAVLSTQESDLALNDALVSVDARLFQEAIARRDESALAEAVSLYRGPFLEGERSPSSAFEEWLGTRRAEFLEHTVDALLKLGDSDEVAGLHESALAHARRALTLDPLREDAHRQVMRCLAAMGQRSNALRQYEILRQVLAGELEVTPEAETEALRETIAHGAEPVSSARTAAVARRGGTTGLPAVQDQERITMHAAALVRVAPRLAKAAGSWRTLALLPIALGVPALIAVGVGSFWGPATSKIASAPAAPVAGLPLATAPPPLSIVVLPLVNLGGDPDQAHFADGVTDELTTDLSRIDGTFVVARQTAFTYKANDSIDVRAVGRELGIRYVLSGSIRRVGERVSITVELVDAATAAKLWTERFDGSGAERPALQSEVTSRIAATLRLELIEAEGRRIERQRESDPIAADDALRGWAIVNRPYSRQNHAEARRLFERAIAKDPSTVPAMVGLAHVLAGYSKSPIEDRRRADELLRQALDLEPNRADTHFVLGQLRRVQGHLREAAEAYQTAIKLDRNYARAYLLFGVTSALLGRPDETIPLAQHAMRLNPRDPNIGDYHFVIGSAQTLLGRADEAIESLARANAANPRLWYFHLHLAGAYGMRSQIEEAKREISEALRLRPEVNSLAAIQATMASHDHPAYVALAEQTLYAGLRRAGFPDR
jgi:TolB-like protein/DNA-binding SARP family transcriptional activator/Flp pilus assembly protein TadD